MRSRERFFRLSDKYSTESLILLHGENPDEERFLSSSGFLPYNPGKCATKKDDHNGDGNLVLVVCGFIVVCGFTRKASSVAAYSFLRHFKSADAKISLLLVLLGSRRPPSDKGNLRLCTVNTSVTDKRYFPFSQMSEMESETLWDNSHATFVRCLLLDAVHALQWEPTHLGKIRER